MLQRQKLIRMLRNKCRSPGFQQFAAYLVLHGSVIGKIRFHWLTVKNLFKSCAPLLVTSEFLIYSFTKCFRQMAFANDTFGIQLPDLRKGKTHIDSRIFQMCIQGFAHLPDLFIRMLLYLREPGSV